MANNRAAKSGLAAEAQRKVSSNSNLNFSVVLYDWFEKSVQG